MPAKSKGKPTKPKGKSKVFWRKVKKILLYSIIFFFGSTIGVTILYKWVNPPITPLMVIRVFEQIGNGDEIKMSKDWVDIDEINGNMSMAVIASEDNNFLKHKGIDMKAIKRAQELNKKRKRKLGASTITQQTAKNVFLTPSRTYLRKALELYFTGLIEFVWGKERIMEVYLNVIEMGDGIYGVEAASQKYFDKPAAKLTRIEAATIAAILPNPRLYKADPPSKYVKKRRAKIASIIGNYTRPEWVKRKK